VRLRLRQQTVLDQRAFRPVHQTNVVDLLLQDVVLPLQTHDAAVRRLRQLDSPKQKRPVQRFRHHEYACVLHAGRYLVGHLGLHQQHHARPCAPGRKHGQLVAELVRQRRVDEDDLPVRVGKAPPRLGAGSHGGYVPRAHVRQHSAQHIAALFSAGYDQRARQRPHPLAAPKYYIL